MAYPFLQWLMPPKPSRLDAEPGAGETHLLGRESPRVHVSRRGGGSSGKSVFAGVGLTTGSGVFAPNTTSCGESEHRHKILRCSNSVHQKIAVWVIFSRELVVLFVLFDKFLLFIRFFLMLLSFQTRNFLSFRDPVEFSTVASREIQHGERLIRVRDHRILPTSAIFGGNGSGKSNLAAALRFARRLVTVGTDPDDPTGRRAFKLDEACSAEPSWFQFELLAADEKCYRYEFEIDDRHVAMERLVEIRPASEKVIFSRDGANPGQGWDLEFFDNKSRFSDDDRQFLRFVARGTRGNQLFLRETVDRNVAFFRPVYDWFASQLVILEPDSSLEPLETILQERDDLREFASAELRNADTGIAELLSEEIPLNAATEIPPEMRDRARRDLKKEGVGLLFRSTAGHRLSIYLHQGDLVVSRLYTQHEALGGRRVRFEMNEESEGTRRLIDLLPALFDLKNPKTRRVYVVDELDRSMHSALTRSLLEGFLSAYDPDRRGQLIFTTHEEQLMSQDLLRRDEIWFLTKGRDGASFLECLADYEGVRNDTDIRKGYLLGRYSGIPEIAEIPAPPARRGLVNA